MSPLKSMPKKSNKAGKNISSKAEVQNISDQGIWIFVHDKEFFLSFTEFPWFLKATIEQIYNLEYSGNKHLYWPALDIDIDLDSIVNLGQYPLKYL